jgi:hypothetical protein
MNFMNPWAWLGALLVAVPLAVHMLARSRAPEQRFPTLRFFQDTRIVAVRRSRITDVPLLLVRCAMVLAAVAALAHPYVVTRERQAELSRRQARVVVVDTSASMLRASPSGGTALDAASRIAAGHAAAGDLVVHTADPGAVIAAAASLLSRRPGSRELVILSDFQPGTLTGQEAARLPDGMGLVLRRLETAGTLPAPAGFLPGAGASGAGAPAFALLAGAADAQAGAAVLEAALHGVAPAGDGRRAYLLMPGYAQREDVLQGVVPPAEPWMLDAIAAAMRDPVLAAAAASAPRVSGAGAVEAGALSSAMLPVATQHDGRHLVGAAAWRDGAGEALLLAVQPGAPELVAAAAVAAVGRAMEYAAPLRELEPSHVQDAVLASWERPAAPAVASGDAEPWDGRWFWLLVLLLLGAETVMRRRMAREAAHA